MANYRCHSLDVEPVFDDHVLVVYVYFDPVGLILSFPFSLLLADGIRLQTPFFPLLFQAFDLFQTVALFGDSWILFCSCLLDNRSWSYS